MFAHLLAASGIFLAFALPAGYWGGAPAAIGAVVVAALILLARHEWQIGRLKQWAEQPIGTPVPEASGSWSDAFLALHRRARQAAAQRDELREMVERFRLAAEALPEGVVILDSQRTIEWMNPRAELLLGLDARRDIRMPVTHLVREPEFARFIDAPRDEENGEPLLVRPMRNPAAVLHIRAAPFSSGRTLLLIEDLTQIERLENVRRDFVANVSHEMRTPLTVVQGFLETARDGLADEVVPTPREEVVHYLDLALDHAHRMQRLIEDLLTLSTLETAAAPPLEEQADVNGLLALVQEEARALSAGRHRIELENNGPPLLSGSSRELHSAFSNLVSNAVRYTPEGGLIVLRWRSMTDGGAVFEVVDSGIGIESSHIARLTERFYRVDRGRSRESGGTGLGLAIVKHVLERHQATLAIDSELGRGSTFSAAFPARRVGGN